MTRQSQVLPIPPCTCTAVSQTVRVARAQYTFATRAARIASVGASSSTAHAACRKHAHRTFDQRQAFGQQMSDGLIGPDHLPYCSRIFA